MGDEVRYAAYVNAIERVSLQLSLDPGPRGVLAICLRLQAHDVTLEQVALVAELLVDDVDFVHGVVRYGAPMTGADWIAHLRMLPTPGRRYTPGEVEDFLPLGFSRDQFPTVDGNAGAPKPHTFVPR